MSVVKVKPAQGARIRQPNRNFRVMSQEGDLVDQNDSYYHRLINSGDLVIVREEESKPPKKGKSPNPPPDKDHRFR